MKDKEKLIDEKIKEIAECNKESCQDCKITCTYYYAIKRFCELYLPEDSVVLSRDKYNRLKRDSELFEELVKKKAHLETVIELSNAQYEKVLEENKSLLRLISLIDDLPEESLLDLDKWIEAIKAKIRKETAEKNLKAFGYCNDTNFYAKWLELCKQFSLEIKENKND